MSDLRLTCSCGEPLRADANYCAGCGLEVYQTCPACGEGERRRLLTIVATTAPWCENRGALLVACERCGRWLLPDTRRCPDPACEARVLPVAPQYTGRRWDGRGGTAGWTWPARWEAIHPQYSPPQVDRWASPDPLLAAFVAHDRLYVWAGANLLALTGDSGVASSFGTADSASGAVWRAALGVTARAASHLSLAERVAVVGAGAVLATERSFLLTGLYSRSDTERLEAGTPLAQVGGPNWWAGWGVVNSTPTLHYAGVGQNWDMLLPTPVETPADAALAANGRLVLRDDLVYWPGQDGGVWQLDCLTGTVVRAVAPQEGLREVWAEPDGPRTVREVQGRLLVGISAPHDARMPQEVPSGAGPLRGIFATRDHVVVVGDRILAYDARTGERLYEVNRPPGRWIAGTLANGTGNEGEGTSPLQLRLLALTVDGGMARLSALKVSNGIEDLLLTEPNVEPLALLPIGTNLYIAHSRGLIRLKEA
jgi:hypothetical protein